MQPFFQNEPIANEISLHSIISQPDLFFALKPQENKKIKILKSVIPVNSVLYTKIKEIVKFKDGNAINTCDSKGKKQGLWFEFDTDTIRFEKNLSKKGTYKSKTTQNKDTVIEFEWNFPKPYYNDSSTFIEPGGSKPYDFNIVNDSIRIKYTITVFGNYKDDFKEGFWTNRAGCNLQKITYAKGVIKGPFRQYYANGRIMFKGNIVPGKKEQVIKGYSEKGVQDTVITNIP
ncbi:MAG: hypothetical protein IAF38_13340, partial [Bacteroidia bacterium]|nr:hypothetical protein [Bacteroidia bacterium]